MSLAVWQRTIVTSAGDAIPSAQVEVFVAGTTTNATLFQDAAGGTSLTNPFNATAAGFAQFYVAPGQYDIAASGGGSSITWDDVRLDGGGSSVFSTRAQAVAARVPAVVDVISVYHGGIWCHYERDASGTALTTADGQKWSPSGGDCTPAHWGGSPGRANDATTAVQACFDYARTKYDATASNWLAWVNFAGQFWRCTASIDAVDIRQPYFRFGNGGLHFDMSSGYGLQMFGVNRAFMVEPFSIELPQDPDACPEFGFCFGVCQASGGGAVDIAPAMKGTIRIDGAASKSSILNLGSEVSAVRAFVDNQHYSDDAFCYAGIGDMQDAVDRWGSALTSSFCTLPATSDGAFSNILHDLGSSQLNRTAHWVATITGVTQANPAVVSFTVASAAQSARMANGQSAYIDNSMGGMTELKRNSYTVANLAVAGDGLSGTFELSGVDSTGYTAFASDGSVARATGPAAFFGSANAINIGPEASILTYGAPAIVAHCRNNTLGRLRFSGQAEKTPRNIVEIDVAANSVALVGWELNILAASQIIDAPFKLTRTTGSAELYAGYVNIAFGSAFADELCTGGANLAARNFTIIAPVPIDVSGLQTFTGMQLANAPPTMRWYLNKNTYIDMSSGQWTMPNFAMVDKLFHDGDTDTAIRFPLDNTFVVETGGIETLRVNSAQNVGIGEPAPNYKLDVNGSIGFTPGASVTPVDNGDVVIQATNNTTLTFKLKGDDGTVRSGTVTLA